MTTSIARAESAGVNRRILRAATSVVAAGIVVKVAATFKEFVVAGVYGRSDAMDAFLAAFLIPNLLINLIAESMNQALVPTLIRVKIREGCERAQQLLSSSMLWMCGLLTAASLGMAVLARAFFPLIGSGFSAQKLDLSVRLFYALLPVVLLSGIATNCTAVLNTLDRFAVPALAPLVMPVSIIAGALLLHGRWGIWALVSVPIAGLLILGAQPLVRVTLQHGAFGPRDTAVVTSVLAMYAIQIPFFVVSRVFYRFVVAMRRTDLVLYCGILNLGLDVVLNLALMRWLGVAGIALATSLWTVGTLAFLWYWANRLLAAAGDEVSQEAGA